MAVDSHQLDQADRYVEAAIALALQGPWLVQLDDDGQPVLTSDVRDPALLEESLKQLGLSDNLTLHAQTAVLDAAAPMGLQLMQALLAAHMAHCFDGLAGDAFSTYLPPIHAPSLVFLAGDDVKRLPATVLKNFALPTLEEAERQLWGVRDNPLTYEIDVLRSFLKQEHRLHGTRRAEMLADAQEALDELQRYAPNWDAQPVKEWLDSQQSAAIPLKREVMKWQAAEALESLRYSPRLAWEDERMPDAWWLKVQMDSPSRMVMALAEATRNLAVDASRHGADMGGYWREDTRLIHLPDLQGEGKGRCLFAALRGEGMGKSELMAHLEAQKGKHDKLSRRDDILGEPLYRIGSAWVRGLSKEETENYRSRWLSDEEGAPEYIGWGLWLVDGDELRLGYEARLDYANDMMDEKGGEILQQASYLPFSSISGGDISQNSAADGKSFYVDYTPHEAAVIIAARLEGAAQRKR